MLVLSRKPGERILIGDQIAITIVRIGPNTVRVGIDAPREMTIVREELERDSGHGHEAETALPAVRVEPHAARETGSADARGLRAADTAIP
jgi:carbon storage regulator